MSLLPKEEIGEEVHEVDQFLRIESGSGEAVLDDVTHSISQGNVLIVPAGVKHNLVNTGADNMKLYTLYMPPHHKRGTVHKTKNDAMMDTQDVFGEND
jgi:mannose-6-phosphate isomerase-like protein (cupin superfamily)